MTFGGTTASVVSWSDTAVLVTVPGTLTSGQTVSVVLTTTAGASNTVDFTVVSTTAPYRVSPQNLNLLVGQTRTVSVTDSNGNAVTGLDWTTSDATIASLSSDDPPLITAVAPGTAIVYVVGMPILVTVYSGTSLPSGTPIWSVPTNSATFSPMLVPAVPSSSGTDVLVLEDSRLRALTGDASTVWEIGVDRDPSSQAIPGFSGSTFVTEPYFYRDTLGGHVTHILARVDTNTHQLTTLYTFAHLYYPVRCGGLYCSDDTDMQHTIIPHPSGPLFVLDAPPQPGIEYTNYCTDPTTGEHAGCYAKLTVLNPSTNQTVASVVLESSVTAANGNHAPPTVGPMIVAGDGNAYLPYSYYNKTISTVGSTCCYLGTDILDLRTQVDTYLKVLRVSADGTYSKIELGNWTGDSTDAWTIPENGDPVDHATCTGAVPLSLHLGVITNAAAGATVFANGSFGHVGYCPDNESLPQPLNQMSFVSQNGLGSQVTLALPPPSNWDLTTFVPALQREDGSYIGTDWEGNLDAVGLEGSVVWQQQIGTGSLTPLYATADGGAIVTSTPQCNRTVVRPDICSPVLGTLYTVDQNGNVTSQTPDIGAVYSWTNQWYDPPPAGATISAVTLPALYLAMTFAGIYQGNASLTGAAVPQQPYAPLPSCHATTLNPPLACPGPKEAVDDALSSLRARLLTGPCPGCSTAFATMRSHGVNIYQPDFYLWLTKEPRFYDGTRSSNRMNDVMCSSGFFATVFGQCSYATHKERVSQFMNEGSEGWMTAISRTPSESDKGMLTFFDPAQICRSEGSTAGAIQNQAVIFHEAFHGYTGLYDPAPIAGLRNLEGVLGIPYDPHSSVITDYLRVNVLGGEKTNSCGN